MPLMNLSTEKNDTSENEPLKWFFERKQRKNASEIMKKFEIEFTYRDELRSKTNKTTKNLYNWIFHVIFIVSWFGNKACSTDATLHATNIFHIMCRISCRISSVWHITFMQNWFIDINLFWNESHTTLFWPTTIIANAF